ncbi:MAG: hypothetical protein OEY44_05085 [Candidatus Peregrinibacteria bacterium]|nr:hypothetical protein [Candidatus Peregrinibacteria bacterium]
MNGDLMPIGGHKKKYDPKHAQKIKEGGKRAEEIRKKTVEAHQQEEVPIAEDNLLKELEEVQTDHLEKAKK